MPRNISPELKAHFGSESITVCTCMKITRKDLTVLGFTNINKTLTIDGVDYVPSGAIGATATHSSATSGVDNLDMTGFIDNDLIVADEVIGGLFDGADVEIFRVNYEDLTMGSVMTFRGKFGVIQLFDRDKFTVELLSLSHMLKQSVGDITSVTCRVHRFGDSQCKVDIAPYSFVRYVDSVISTKRIRFAADLNVSMYFDYGLVKFNTGNNSGLQREVKSHERDVNIADIVLRRSFPFQVGVGDEAVLIRGCDRRFVTCVNSFSNAVNFRGEPHLPGNDQITQRGRPPE